MTELLCYDLTNILVRVKAMNAQDASSLLVKSYQNCVSHNTGAFRARHPPVFCLRPVIAILEHHTTRAGGRPKFAEKHRCYDSAIFRKTDSSNHHHPEVVVYRSFCINSNTFAV